MKCWKCPYKEKVQRKYGTTFHCNLEPTHMDVTYHVRYNNHAGNKLCPFIDEKTRWPGVNYDKYIDDEIASWLEERNEK